MFSLIVLMYALAIDLIYECRTKFLIKTDRKIFWPIWYLVKSEQIDFRINGFDRCKSVIQLTFEFSGQTFFVLISGSVVINLSHHSILFTWNNRFHFAESLQRNYLSPAGMGVYAGAALRRVHLTTVLRPPSGHRPGRRQARHVRILQIGLRLAIAQADTRPVMPISFR